MENNKKTAMRTSLLSDMITSHHRKIAAINPDENFRVVSVTGDEDIMVVQGVVEKEEKNV